MVTEVSTVETISSIWRIINPSSIQLLVLVLFIIFVKVGSGVVTRPSVRTVEEMRLGTQKFYLKHTDDIISMAVHTGDKHGNIVASGQIGENPTIHVWNPQTRNTISVLSGRHKRGVCSLSFSTSGKLLLSVGVDAPYTIAVWRWEEGLIAILRHVDDVFLSSSFKGICVACTIGSEERIFRALFRPNSDTHFVSAGVKHLKFWSVAGNTLVEKKAVITKTTDGRRSAKMQTMLSIAFGPVSRDRRICLSSSSTLHLTSPSRKIVLTRVV